MEEDLDEVTPDPVLATLARYSFLNRYFETCQRLLGVVRLHFYPVLLLLSHGLLKLLRVLGVESDHGRKLSLPVELSEVEVSRLARIGLQLEHLLMVQ